MSSRDRYRPWFRDPPAGVIAAAFREAALTVVPRDRPESKILLEWVQVTIIGIGDVLAVYPPVPVPPASSLWRATSPLKCGPLDYKAIARKNPLIPELEYVSEKIRNGLAVPRELIEGKPKLPR